MIVQELINRLNEIVEANPENANAEVKWYDEFENHISHGEGNPIQLYKRISNGEVQCILNTVDGNPDPGYIELITDAGEVIPET